MPLCEPWVRSLAARNRSGNSDDRPSPVTNSPARRRAASGPASRSRTPTAASAAPPRRVRSRPRRSVTWSPTTRPTSMPPATATKPEPGLPGVEVEAVAHHQRRPVVGRQLGERDRHRRRGTADEDRAAALRGAGVAVGDRSAVVAVGQQPAAGDERRQRPARTPVTSSCVRSEIAGGRGAAGDQAAGDRAGRPHGVEAGDDRASGSAAAARRPGSSSTRRSGRRGRRARAARRTRAPAVGARPSSGSHSDIAADVVTVVVRLPRDRRATR